MRELIQLAYISKASSSNTTSSSGGGGNISKILQVSRRNNRAQNLAGALYYGNGAYFQCLEGEHDPVMALYEKLKTDTRHSDLRIMYKKAIHRRTFDQWEMKYMPQDQDMEALFSSFGMKEFDPFDPYAFNEVQASEMVRMMASSASLEKPKSVAQVDRMVNTSNSGNSGNAFNSSRVLSIFVGVIALMIVFLGVRFFH